MKRSWPNLKYYTGTCVEGLRKITKNLSQDSRSPGRDLNLGSPEYEEGVLTTQPRRSRDSSAGRVTVYELDSRGSILARFRACVFATIVR
jgi:hypothetical protein